MKNVEVATNPSAKDDPEGTAGIINIVLNQEAELGLSGGVDAGTASTGMVNGDGNVGKQQGKLTVFASGNIYQDRRVDVGHHLAHESRDPGAGVQRDAPRAASSRPSPAAARSAPSIGSRHATRCRSTASIFGGHFGGDQSSAYTDLDASARGHRPVQPGQRRSSRAIVSQDFDIDVPPPRRKEPTAVLDGARVLEQPHSTNDIDLSGTVLRSDASTPAAIPTEHDHTVGRYPYLNWKADYTGQFGANTKLETGLKGTRRNDVERLRRVVPERDSGQYESDPARRTSYDYHEDIGAAYALLSNKIDKVQTQAGLRLEDAATYLDLTDRRPAVRPALRERVPERDRLVQLHASRGRRGSAIRAA